MHRSIRYYRTTTSVAGNETQDKGQLDDGSAETADASNDALSLYEMGWAALSACLHIMTDFLMLMV